MFVYMQIYAPKIELAQYNSNYIHKEMYLHGGIGSIAASQLQHPWFDPKLGSQCLLCRISSSCFPLGLLRILWFPLLPPFQKHAYRVIS